MRILTILAVLMLPVCLPAQVLTGFGSGDLNPFNTSTGFLGGWTGTVDATSLSVTSVSNQSGGIYVDFASAISIVGNTGSLTLTGSLTSSTPLTNNFQITLYDSSFSSLSYNFSWSAFASGPAAVTVNLAGSSGTFNGSVKSWGLSLFGSPGDTVSFNFANLQAGAIPEPTTYAAIIGLVSLGLCVVRRRRRA